MQSGDLIGHYRLTRDIGAGSFATVWLARDELLDADVALKVLADNWARNPDVRRRFIEEARILRRLDHDRIVRVFTVGELPGGQPYFVMAHADRGTLADRLAARLHHGFHSPAEAVGLVGELCGCLDVVHAMGIVHRDLKPSNVLFRARRTHEAGDGDLMQLADFGLAKDLVVASGLTLAAGTPAYMAPEQARASASIDQRTDVYAAGAILFELLAGRPPTNAETLSGVRRADVAGDASVAIGAAGVPAALRTVIARALSAERSDRYPSAAEFAAAAYAALDPAPTTAPPPTTARLPSAVAQSADRPLSRRVRSLIEGLGPSTGALAAALAELDDGPLRIGRTHAAAGFTLAPAFDAVLIDLDTPPTAVDVVVFDDTTDDPTEWRAHVGDRPGPVRAFAMTDVDDAAVGALCDRLDAVRASAALGVAEAIVKAGSANTSAAWLQSADARDRLRFDAPQLDELGAARGITAGSVLLPASMRPEALAALTGGAEGSSRATLAELIGRWREYQSSGRAPFGSRSTVDLVVRAAERAFMHSAQE